MIRCAFGLWPVQSCEYRRREQHGVYRPRHLTKTDKLTHVTENWLAKRAAGWGQNPGSGLDLTLIKTDLIERSFVPRLLGIRFPWLRPHTKWANNAKMKALLQWSSLKAAQACRTGHTACPSSRQRPPPSGKIDDMQDYAQTATRPDGPLIRSLNAADLAV